MKISTSIKDYILINYNQEELFARYLGISIKLVKKAIDTNTNIKNPLRSTDNDPSLKLSYVKDKLKMWDFGSMLFRGDIFDLVGIILNKNPNNKLEFIEICEHIKMNKPIENVSNVEYHKHDINFKLEYVPKSYSKHDTEYWNKANVSTKHLYNRGVDVAKYATFNGDTFYTYNSTDPLFIYNLGIDKGIDIRKSYRPYGKKTDKFKNNNKFLIEGINEFYESDVLIITKSRKDKLVIECNLNGGIIKTKLDILVKSLPKPVFNPYIYFEGFYSRVYHIDTKFCVTNLANESTLLPPDLVNYLKTKHKIIVINYDYDYAGLLNAFYYYKVFNFIPIFIGRDKDVVISKLDTKVLSVLFHKLRAVNIDSNEEEFIDFISVHSGTNTSKDWYELACEDLTKCKTIMNESFNRF